MVLVTQKLQDSHVLFPSSSPTWTKGLNIRRPLTTVRFVGKKEKYLRLEAKSLRVTCFKGGIQNNESGRRRREGKKKVTNNSVKLRSYRSEDDDENNVNGSSPKAQNTSLSYTSESEDSSITGQPAIQKLFKKWLTMLRTQSPIQVIDEASGGEPVQESSVSETETEISKNTVWSWFWNLDASIKIPLLLFVPAFVTVNGIYGVEVTKELSPLWIFGPLIVAFYIKMFRGLCALYTFCFDKTVKLIRNLPAYYLVAYQYIASGKFKDDVRDLVIRVAVAIKDADYKEITSRKLKELRVWMVERYLDFVESIWPYYCRTIRFLKRSNFI